MPERIVPTPPESWELRRMGRIHNQRAEHVCSGSVVLPLAAGAPLAKESRPQSCSGRSPSGAPACHRACGHLTLRVPLPRAREPIWLDAEPAEHEPRAGAERPIRASSLPRSGSRLRRSRCRAYGAASAPGQLAPHADRVQREPSTAPSPTGATDHVSARELAQAADTLGQGDLYG